MFSERMANRSPEDIEKIRKLLVDAHHAQSPEGAATLLALRSVLLGRLASLGLAPSTASYRQRNEEFGCDSDGTRIIAYEHDTNMDWVIEVIWSTMDILLRCQIGRWLHLSFVLNWWFLYFLCDGIYSSKFSQGSGRGSSRKLCGSFFFAEARGSITSKAEFSTDAKLKEAH